MIKNGCTEEDLRKFNELPFKNKLFFTCKEWPKSRGYIKIRQYPRRENKWPLMNHMEKANTWILPR